MTTHVYFSFSFKFNDSLIFIISLVECNCLYHLLFAGIISAYYRNGCATSEDLFWKLDALQSFIRDLHWPDAEFRQHLEQRLKLMACDMIESCIQRYLQFLICVIKTVHETLREAISFDAADFFLLIEPD
jgi:hypothetical protein